MKLTAPLAGAGVGAALALLAGLANSKGDASSASSGSGATLPDAGNGAPSMGTRDPVQDVSTSALPVPAGQRPSPVAAQPAMGGPDAIMQANIAQEMAQAPQGTQGTASSPLSTGDVLTALLGASPAAMAAAHTPPPAGMSAGDALTRASPVMSQMGGRPVAIPGQPQAALPEPMKLLPAPEQQGPQDIREGPHNDGVGPPMNPTKQFSVGGKTYLLDDNGNVLSEGGEMLGKASTMFKGNKAATRALSAIGRTVK